MSDVAATTVGTRLRALGAGRVDHHVGRLQRAQERERVGRHAPARASCGGGTRPSSRRRRAAPWPTPGTRATPACGRRTTGTASGSRPSLPASRSGSSAARKRVNTSPRSSRDGCSTRPRSSQLRPRPRRSAGSCSALHRVARHHPERLHVEHEPGRRAPRPAPRSLGARKRVVARVSSTVSNVLGVVVQPGLGRAHRATGTTSSSASRRPTSTCRCGPRCSENDASGRLERQAGRDPLLQPPGQVAGVVAGGDQRVGGVAAARARCGTRSGAAGRAAARRRAPPARPAGSTPSRPCDPRATPPASRTSTATAPSSRRASPAWAGVSCGARSTPAVYGARREAQAGPGCVAPTYVAWNQGSEKRSIRTKSPVCGACTTQPLPM